MFKFNIVPDIGESYEVEAKTRDIVAWETSNKGASFQKLTEEMRLTDLYELAYHAAVRNGNFVGSKDIFKNSVDIEFDADEQDPTNADR